MEGYENQATNLFRKLCPKTVQFMETFGNIRDRKHHCPILVSLVFLHFTVLIRDFFITVDTINEKQSVD